MSMLDESTKKQVKDFFNDLKNDVKIVVFTDNSKIITPGEECPNCEKNVTLMKEISELSDKIKLEINDFKKDEETARRYGVDKIPATVITDNGRKGIRFFGIPAGHEFSTLISIIKNVSENNSELSEESKSALDKLAKPVHIQVFVTLSCPYCAPVASLAYRFTLYSNLITADIINAQEFPETAQKYNVFAVPKIIINETMQFEGAIPENDFVNKILAVSD